MNEARSASEFAVCLEARQGNSSPRNSKGFVESLLNILHMNRQLRTSTGAVGGCK